jgi:AraC family transcriptional regulator
MLDESQPDATPQQPQMAGEAEPARGGLASWQLSRVICLIDANLTRPIRIADLAASIRLSPSYFHQAFRRSTGVSPYAYIIHRRMARVQELLLSTSRPVSQIALECGLADQPHLTRQFRSVFGMSPVAWRRAQREATLTP